VQVLVAVGKSAAVADHGVIEQGRIAFLVVLEFPQERGEQLDVIGIDRGNLVQKDRIHLVVRDRMVAVRDTNLRIGTVRALAAHHHRGDARQIRLEGDEQHVGHQLEVVAAFGGNTKRFFHAGVDRHAVLFRFLHLLLHLADGGQILVELAAIHPGPSTFSIP